MDLDFILPLALFAFASAITPGPNNVMLLASGANFGIRRTLPHWAGVSGGFALMTALGGLGLAGVFTTHPAARTALTVLSVAYLLYLAFRIATAKPPKDADAAPANRKPMTFLQAALFQWVNPKAWAGALTAVTVYAPGDSAAAVLATAVLASLFGAPCNLTWVVMGRQLRHVLNDPRRLRVFNVTMALLLVASLYPLLF